MAWGSHLLGPSRPRAHVPPEVLRQQIAIMNSQVPKGLLINAVVALALGWSLMTPETRTAEEAWMLGALLLSGIRYVDGFSRRYLGLDPADLARARMRLQWGSALQGLLWGVAGTFLLPSAPVQQVSLIAVISGMTAGAIIIQAPFWSAYALYTIPTVFPLCCCLLAGELPAQKLTGILGLVYGCVMLLMAAQVSRWLEQSLTAARENEVLTADLRAANQALMDYHARLEAAVMSRTQELNVANARLRQEASRWDPGPRDGSTPAAEASAARSLP